MERARLAGYGGGRGKRRGVKRQHRTLPKNCYPTRKKKEIVRRRGNTDDQDSGNRDGGNKRDGDDDDGLEDAAARLIAEYGATLTLDEARRVKANFHAKLTQLEYEQKAGLLLPFDDMLHKVGEEYARMRTRLIAIPPEHGPRLKLLALTSDDTEFVAALQDVIYEAMEELSADGSHNPASG